MSRSPRVFLFACLLAGCGSPPGPTTFAAINSQVLQLSCTFSSCHSVDGAKDAYKLDLKTDPYTALVNAPAQNPRAMSEGKMRVKPGDSANSMLYLKLTIQPGPGNLCPTNTPNDVPAGSYGGCMPETSNPLDQNVIDGIKKWIDLGALNN